MFDLFFILVLGSSFSWIAIVLYSILVHPVVQEVMEKRSENDHNTFDK